MIEKKSEKIKSSESDYNDAIVSEDPTIISTEDLEILAKDAVKKFKSLGQS